MLQSSIANTGGSLNGESDGFTDSASSVNLRGMGANRTLVLINGRRQASFPSAAGGTSNFVDVSDIPTAAVARIEILTGGASAIYGSDAVGGVVNIILKTEYEGAKVAVKYNDPTQGGGEQLGASPLQERHQNARRRRRRRRRGGALGVCEERGAVGAEERPGHASQA